MIIYDIVDEPKKNKNVNFIMSVAHLNDSKKFIDTLMQYVNTPSNLKGSFTETVMVT